MKKIICAVLAAVLLVSTLAFAACGGGNSATTLLVYGWGDQDSLPVFNELIEDFNETIGAETGYEAKFVVENTNYETLLETAISGDRGPDVFFVKDQYFKKWVKLGFAEPLDSYVTDATGLDDMWDSAVSRFRYTVSNNTSTADSPLYGLPLDNSTTALYYNKTALEAVGIIVISCDEENVTDEFAQQFNAEHGTSLTATDLRRGFYRDNPVSDGYWMMPADGETMVFNNRIPMSWDEIEDLARILTKSAEYNPASPTDFGYYTEWWFNYGFSVGGDCIEDTTGDGDWTFTLGDDAANYIVNEGCEIDGHSYAAGDFVSHNDKHSLANDASAANALVSEGKISELPSTREAFSRFVNLSQTAERGGIEVSPTTTGVTGSGQQKSGFFANQKVALLVDYSYNAAAIRRLVGDTFEWDVAPLPMYKDYNADGTVRVAGKEAGHSSSSAMAISTKSNKKDIAFRFIEYWTGVEGQSVVAASGFNVPNQSSLLDTYYASVSSPANMRVFAEAAEVQTPGDWWYMPDKLWIDSWAQALNQKVRNNSGMTLDEFFAQFNASTLDSELAKYKEN